MAYSFVKDRTAKFSFIADVNTPSDSITLNGINATLASADSICAGIDSLMAIGGNEPYYSAGKAKRTVIENVHGNN